MGLRPGFAGSQRRLYLFCRLIVPRSGNHCLVIEWSIVDFLAALLNSGQSSFSQAALTDHLIDCELSNRLSVQTFGERNNEPLALCPDHLIVVQSESCRNVASSFISQQTNIELSEHLVPLFPEPNLLVEDKSALLRRCDLFGEGLSCLLDHHLAGELHFHPDCHQREVELQRLLLFGLRHRSRVPIWTFELYKYIKPLRLLQRTTQTPPNTSISNQQHPLALLFVFERGGSC